MSSGQSTAPAWRPCPRSKQASTVPRSAPSLVTGIVTWGFLHAPAPKAPRLVPAASFTLKSTSRSVAKRVSFASRSFGAAQTSASSWPTRTFTSSISRLYPKVPPLPAKWKTHETRKPVIAIVMAASSQKTRRRRLRRTCQSAGSRSRGGSAPSAGAAVVVALVVLARAALPLFGVPAPHGASFVRT